MQGFGHADVPVVLQVPGNAADVVPCERLSKIMFGKPVIIRNTRITVELILRKLAGGMTVEEIVTEHPYLSEADIRAAQEFAADFLANEQIAFG